MTRTFEDHVYASSDGLSLYARLYSGGGGLSPLLCLHGLTRNSRDFHDFLCAFPNRPAISVDQRGRGRSDYDPDPTRYRPDIYCQDMITLLDDLDVKSVIAVGTSMGGLMSWMMSAQRPDLFAGMIINDIGPDIDPAGLDRLQSYVGKHSEFPDWGALSDAIKSQGPDIFPDFTAEDWLAFAHRVGEDTADGRVRFSYDPAIADGLSGADKTAAPPDLWPLFLAQSDIPMMVLRGETSDILANETVKQMVTRRSNTQLVIVPNRGHAPTLTEPVALDAIRPFLKDLP